MDKYLFVPIYNLDCSLDILNHDIIKDLKIISREQFYAEYKDKICEVPDLEEDIRIPKRGDLYTRDYARYLFVKESINTDEKLTSTTNFINQLILGLRIFKSGFIQVSNYYVASKFVRSRGMLPISTSIENISNVYSTSPFLNFEIYKLLPSDFEKDGEHSEIFKVLVDNRYNPKIPCGYFIKYYSDRNLYDKLLSLTIILESLLLVDNPSSELSYKMQLRTITLLGRDVSNIIKLTYDLRSGIVHNGDISKSVVKKLKELMPDKDFTDSLFYLFCFLRDYLEPVVRDVLKKIFKEMLIRENNNISNIVKNLDKKIIKKLSE